MTLILCAVDFDPGDDSRLTGASYGALRHAYALARDTGARVLVLHVLPVSPDVLIFSGGEAAATAAAHGRRVGDALTRLRTAAAHDRPPDVRMRVASGRPDQEIVRVAMEVGAGTIVLGRPRHGPLIDALLGSTFHRVLARAPCPVLVAAALEPWKAEPNHAAAGHGAALADARSEAGRR